MKKKKRIFIHILFVIGILLILINGCKNKSKSNSGQVSILTTTDVTDIDGNVYHSVTIGTQIWMVENLKVTHYRNGNAIPNINDNKQWGNLKTGALCDYNNNPSNSKTFGKLYNWLAVHDSRKIAPTGWHVPSDAEWNILEKYLDNTVDTNTVGFVGTNIADKLKETGTNHWKKPNAVATNKSGFTALPCGSRNNYGCFDGIGEGCCWWSYSTETSNHDTAPGIVLYDFQSGLMRGNLGKELGLSVRCVKDK